MSDEATIIATNDEPLPAPPVGAAEATRVMAPAPSAPEATQQAISIHCPVCETDNLPGDEYCQECGFLLTSAPPEALPDLSAVPHLVAADGTGEYPLQAGANPVGREDGAILLGDLTVSRDHGAVVLEDGRVFVEDHGSTNGTRVADAAVAGGQRVEAFTGDEVRFGNVKLRLEVPGGEPRPADAAPTPAPAPAPADRGAPAGELLLEDGTQVVLFAGVNTVGRRSSNDIALADPFVSGSHAEIHLEPGRDVILVDIGSTNGSFLEDGTRLAPNAPQTLATGARVRLGKTFVTINAFPAAAEDADSLAGAPPTDAAPAGDAEQAGEDSPAGESEA